LSALQAIYPHYEWKPYARTLFGHTRSKQGSKSQAIMYSTLKTLLPDTTILSNAKVSPDESGTKYFELDVSSIYAKLLYLLIYRRYFFLTFPWHWNIKARSTSYPVAFQGLRQAVKE
jgi:hypothetical protein